SDLFGHFKPDPETYLGVARLLGLQPGQVMMAAAHNNDLLAARKCGLMTAFWPRPTEYGPHQARDYEAEHAFDVVAKDIEDLATQLGV
ncbi:MAG: HAD hydrolase-like protein, partial [Rhodospirillales bacterium]|nr:HAD hydrolase-like protein [Rhodospirillales bacterium]